MLVGLVWGYRLLPSWSNATLSSADSRTAGSSNRQLNTVLEDLSEKAIQENHKAVEPKSAWDALQPLQHSPEPVEVVPGISTGAFNPFHHYLVQLSQPKHFPDLPLWNT